MPTCFLNGICGAQPPKNTKKAIEDPVLAPFVEVQIRASEGAVVAQASNIASIYGNEPLQIGVGNRSFPAVVKSLQIGSMRGAGADIEILDQEGGDFKTIFEKVSRMGTATDCLCWIRWGWISTKCDGSTVGVTSEAGDPDEQPQAGQVTDFIKFVIMNVSLDYSAGTIKYTINCADTLQTFRDTKVPGVIGTSSEGVFFVDAVEQICRLRAVTPIFRAFSSSTTETAFRFRVTDTGNIDAEKGIRGVWRGDNRSVLECFAEWLRPHVADIGPEGRGIRMYFDPTQGINGAVVFMADTVPNCQEQFDPTAFQLGTYLVNGGNCSPVISFKPTIGFTGTNAYSAGGSGGGAASPGTMPNRGPSPCLSNSTAMPHLYNEFSKLLRVGHNVAITLLRDERLGRGRRAMRYAYNNMYMNNLAMLPWSAVSAEMKVQGDPTFFSPMTYAGRFLRLIVINPFQIQDEAPCEWRNSIEPCNEVLSNGAWIVDGVSHDIRNGSYTTTFKIRLATPGFDLSDFAKLGGGGQ